MLWVFYTKWAYTISRIDAKSCWLFGFLAQEGAYTSRCQMPEMRFNWEKQFILYLVRVRERIQNHLDLWIGTVMKTLTRVDGGARVDILNLVLEASLVLLLETMVPPFLPF